MEGPRRSKELADGGTDEVDRGVLDPVPNRRSILKKQASYELAMEQDVRDDHLQPVSMEIKEKPKRGRRRVKKEKKKLIPIWRLFRFAKPVDVLMILVGSVMAMAAGTALPVHMFLFGRVINQFVYYSAAIEIRGDALMNLDTLNSQTCGYQNLTCDGLVDLLQARDLQERINGTCNITASEEVTEHFCSTNDESSVYDNILDFVCEPEDTFIDGIEEFALIYVGLATGVMITMFLGFFLWNVSGYRQARRMRLAFYRSILKQDIGWFDVNESAQLSTRLVDDIEKIRAGIGDKVAVFLQYFTTFISGFIVAFSISWKLALVVATMLPILSFMAAVIGKIIASFTVREQNAYASAGAVAEEVISSIRTVVAFGGEQTEVRRYGAMLKKAMIEGVKKGFFTGIVTGGLFFVVFSTYGLGFWYGSTLILDCELSAGDVVTAFFAVIVGSFSLGNALPEMETFATALGAATVVFETIDRQPVIDSSSEEGEILEHLEGNIEFSDVVFQYPARPDVTVLHGLDLKINTGQTVALVGPSGCGKSTVVQLLQRFYNPNAGLITVDGHDIQTLNLKWLRHNIGIVSQEPVLFNTTITENIRFGREDATMEDIEIAAKSANAHNFIMQFPDGYNTHVGERGAQMSGGQKQRIAIARALVRDPKILLLDEATSALDTESEKVVQEALDKAREGRTTIVIAHRLSTIRTADVIASIEGGRVVEMGSHLELMDNEGLYYELVTAQTIAEEEEKEPLADFRAAVRRSTSRTASTSFQRQESTQSGRPPYSRQGSAWSTGSGDDPFESPGLSGHLSRFSLEDIPGLAHPSPRPGRSTFPGADPVASADLHGDKIDDEADEKEEKTVTFDVEEPRQRRGSLNRLIHYHRRRRQARKEEQAEHPPVSFKELLKLNIPDWPFVLIGVIGSGLIGAMFPLMAILFSDVLEVFGSTDKERIEDEAGLLSLGFVGLAVGAGMIYFIAVLSLATAGERLTRRIRYQAFQAMLRQEIGWFDLRSNSTGALTTRLATESSEVKGATGIRLGTILQTVFGFVTALVIAFTASWELTLVLMVCFPVLGAVGFLQLRVQAGKVQKNKGALEATGEIAVESIENIRTVAGLGVEDKFYNQYYLQLRGPFRSSMRDAIMQAVIFALAQSVIFYIYSAGYRFGAFLVVEERATYDEIFRVFAAVVFTALSLGRASSFAPDAKKAQLSAARIFSLLNRRPEIDNTSTEGMKPAHTTGAIKVDNVHFNYPARPEINVLQGLSVAVSPGQTLALVGPSGCGKSTAVALIERFYDPTAGCVTLDGNDLRDLNLRWLRTQVGIVSQEPVLFDTSIAENIRYGALFRDVSDGEVIEAAKAANIHSFIETLPEGYSTNVGAKGTQMSGGQKQRIAIARALVRDPKVLLLDEATSALDTESEKIVQEALDRAREGRTCIVIAHRLSTVYNSNCIVVIHNGQVIESGTHNELMGLHGAYYVLNTVQLADVEG